MRRSILVTLAATAAAVLLGSCIDDTAGPRQPVAGRFAVVPDFGALQGDIVEVARGRFLVTRIPGGAVAADTIVDIAPGADSVELSIAVPVFSPGETFNLTIRLIDSNGDTVFAGGPIEVTPGTSGTPVPVEVPFTYVGTGADAAGVVIVTPDTSLFTGESLLLTAVAFDAGEVAIPNTPIGWESLDTAVVRITDRDAQYRGTAVGGGQRGVARIVATLVTGQTDTMLVTNQPLPTAIVAESGSGQSGLAGSPLAQPLVARVTAGDGQGVAGLWVRFTVTSGGGTLTADSALTDANGRASVSWTLARSFQPHEVTATTARLGTATAVFDATLVFAPPATLEIVAGNGQSAVAGSAVAVAPQVRVLDAQGLPVPGVTVTFAVTGGGGVVAGGTPVTDTLGLAAVTGWTLGTTAGPNTLTATVNALTATFTATGAAGPATQLGLVSGDAQTGPAGQVLPLPLVVRAMDANGNGVAGATIDWSAANGGVSAPTTVTDTDGLAEVLWTLGETPGSQAATATLQGTATTVPFTATAAAGAAARLVFTVEPTDVRQDSVISPAVVVTAYDAFDNVATGFTGAVQLSLLTNPGGATLGGTTTRAAVAGVATFDDLSLNAFGNGYALLATATGLTPDSSATFDVLAPVGQAYWVNAAGGNWSDAANWLSGTVPAVTDTAWIVLDGTYTVTVDAAVTVDRLVLGATSGTQTLSVSAAPLTVNGNADFGTNAAVTHTSSAVTVGGDLAITADWQTTGATLAVGGTTTLASSASMILDDATLPGTGTITNAGALVVNPGPTSVGGGILNEATASITLIGNNGGASLAVANGLVNAGAIAITGGFGSSLAVTAGTLVNTGSVLSSGTTTHTLAAALDNQGTLDVQGSGNLTLNAPSATHANAGLVQLTGGNLTVLQSGTTPGFTHAGGQLIIPAGRTLTVTGGAFDYSGGAIAGRGTLALTGTIAVAVTPDYQNDTLAVSLIDAAVTGAGALTNTGTWTVQRTTIANAFANSGGLTVNPGASAMNGTFQNLAGATVTLIGNNGGAALTVANGFTNAGAIAITGGFGSSLAVTAGTLVNTGSVLSSGTTTHTLAAALDNQGTLDVQGSGNLTLNAPSATHANAGLVQLTGGNLTVLQSGTTPGFTHAGGQLIIPAGRTLTVTGGAFDYSGGAIAGRGTLALTGTIAVAVTPDYQNDTLAVSLIDAAVTGAGALTNTGTWTVQRTTIANAFANNGGLTVNPGASAMNGTFQNLAGATVTLIGNNGGAALTVANGFTNAGAIAITGGFGSSLTVTAGALVNTGSVTSSGTAGHTLAAALDNQGTLDVQGSGALTLNAPSAAHVNTGTIQIAGGNLAVGQSGTSPSFANQGAFVIGGGRTATITGGTFTNVYDGEGALGVIGGAGTLDVSSTTFTNDGYVAPGFSPGVLTVTGNYTQGLNGRTLLELGGTTPGTGHDQLVVTGGATVNGVVDVSTILAGYTPAAGDRLAVLVLGQAGGEPGVVLPDVSALGLEASIEAVDAAAPIPDTVYVVFSTPAPPNLNSWINPAGGSWGTASNWSRQTVPVSTDSVVIDAAGTYTVTLDQAATVEHLRIGGAGANPTFSHTAGVLTVNATVAVAAGAGYALSGGTLAGPHTGTIDGTLTWNSGTIAGAGTTTLGAGGTSTWPSNNSKFLDTRTLVLDGPVTWSGGGTLQLQNQAALINNSTLSFTSTSPGAFGNVSGPNLVTNAGSFVKSGAGTLSVVTPFNNTGTVDHQAGTITLTGGGTSTGPFTVGTGATLDFLAGTHALGGDVTGAGAMTVSGATVTVGAAATYGLPALIQTGGTVTVNGTLGALDSIRVGGGTLNLQTPAAAITVPRLSLLSGTLQGTDSVMVSNAWDWTGGALGLGFALESGATAIWATNNSRQLNAHTLLLDGPVTWSGGGTLQLQNQATLINNSTLSFTSTNPGAFGNVSGPNLVTNAGSFVKSGAGTLSVVTPFNNTGTVDHQAGTITLTGGGTSTGPFTVGTGATLDFLAGTHTLGGDVTGAGAMTVSGATVTVGAAATYGLPALIQTGGTVTVNGTLGALDSIRVGGGTLNLQTPAAAITVPRLSLLNGTLQGTDSVVVSNAWDWTAGTLGVGFALQPAATATWSTNNSRILNAHTALLDGPVTWSGGGTLQLQNQATLINNSTLSFTSTNPGAFGNVSGPNLVTNAGSFVKSGTGTLSVVTPFNNTGVLDVQAGTVSASSTFTHADGALLRGSGTLDLTNATVSTFSGDVNPGTSPGILTVTTPLGGLTQGPLSTLNIELDGPTVGTEYDRLNLSGNVTLNGSLVVTRSFTPNLGDRFAIMTFANRTGQFSSVTLPLVDGLVLDTLWAIDADAIDTLYLVANAPPAPQIVFAGDSATDAANSGTFVVNPDGSGQTLLTTGGLGSSGDVYPRLAPDRAKMVFTAATSRSGPQSVFASDLAGLVVEVVKDTNTRRARYSPDGRHLAFECGDGGYPSTAQDVCVISNVPADVPSMANVGDGGGKVYVTDAVSPELGGSGAFTWNPTKPEQLAVVRDSVLGAGGPIGSLIWLVSFDGSDPTPLGTRVMLDGSGAPVEVYSMDWSPDGTFIAFEGTSGGTRSIFRIEVSTGVVTQLTAQNQDFRPVVSPDNAEILFGRLSDGWLLMKVPAGGGNVFQMSPFLNFNIDQAGWDWSPDGSEIVVTEDVTTQGVVISRVPRSTNPTSFFSDANAGKVGRRGGGEIQDRHPSWRP
jgi:Tol biopolymer transport system component